MEGRKAAFAKIGRDDRMVGMEETGFKDEREIEDLVSSNLSEIFPCLKKLANQFPVEVPGEVGMDKSRGFIIDTLAFDSQKKCFVVIEYKNKIDNGLIGQVLGYKELIAKNKADFMYVHENSGMTVKDYDWSLPYVIIISPAHTYKQSAAIETLLKLDDNLIKMYEIQKFDDSVVTLDRIKGTPVCTGSHITGSDPIIVGGEPGLGGNALLKKFEEALNGIGDITRKDLKSRLAYKMPTGKNICIVMNQKKRLKIYYGIREYDEILHEDNFVQYDKKAPRKFGAGEYLSVITDFAGIDRAAKLLKMIYEFHTNSERLSGKNKTGSMDKHTGIELHDAFESMIHGVGRLKRNDLYRYTVYRTSNEMNVCTIIEQANRLKLYYAPRDHNHILHGDDFVVYDRRGRLHGAGDYMSLIHTREDVDRAMTPLKKVYDWRMGL
ncbi:MAG: hypothetical protein MPJ06_08165 [Nitrosopumilus sp.]|nr:hypothetical protein [Nitrosopumilus sp.]MDA7943954.1 hypothetical protein [Nitrosopumilus sp.]MDA7999391.1 hypothetical protein [Nitrosopumilus sp.]